MMTTSYFKRFLSVSTTIAVLILKSVNVYSQCPIIPPTVSDTCLIGSQSVQLNATGSTNLYAAYDALIGGNFVGNGNPINVGIVSNTTTFYVAAQAQNYALDFDGSNDKVAINGFTYNATGLNELTVEAWVKTTSTNAMIIASFDRSEYWRLGIGSTGASTGMVSWSVNTNSGYLDMGGNTFVNDG
ncbi:MAG: hypothetical protein R3279_08320, partial [Putridiphycobacter sp.]|nr:hypothetical protein [Putridiphycobacter sp.]